MLRVLTRETGMNCISSFKSLMKSRPGILQLCESFHEHFKTISKILVSLILYECQFGFIHCCKHQVRRKFHEVSNPAAMSNSISTTRKRVLSKTIRKSLLFLQREVLEVLKVVKLITESRRN